MSSAFLNFYAGIVSLYKSLTRRGATSPDLCSFPWGGWFVILRPPPLHFMGKFYGVAVGSS